MNTGRPTPQDEDLIKQNQQASQIPPAGSPPQDNIPINQPKPSIPPAPQSPHPSNDNDLANVGVGTPNIGVEENDIPPPEPKKPPEMPEEKATFETSDVNLPPPPPPKQEPPNETPPPQPTPPTDQVQIRNYQTSQPQSQPPSFTPKPPVKAPNSKTMLIIGTLLALGIGSAAGFYGFRYFDQIKTQAVQESSTTSPESPSTDVSAWPIYNSTLYSFSLKYPNVWKINTTDPQADSIVIASNQESLEGELTGYKIEINFQNANAKNLASWIDANAVTSSEKSKAKEITVSDQKAYQQILSQNGPKVATYIDRSQKIMIVTYSAPQNIFGEGGDWYNKLINSIKLM